MRTCRKCFEEKDLSEFASAGIIKSIQYYRHLCKQCYWLSKKPYREAITKQYYEYKKTLSCKRCGFNDYRVLEFHHFNDDKEFNISDMSRRGFTMKTMMEEIKKCEVLCANCHRIEHLENGY